MGTDYGRHRTHREQTVAIPELRGPCGCSVLKSDAGEIPHDEQANRGLTLETQLEIWQHFKLCFSQLVTALSKLQASQPSKNYHHNIYRAITIANCTWECWIIIFTRENCNLHSPGLQKRKEKRQCCCSALLILLLHMYFINNAICLWRVKAPLDTELGTQQRCMNFISCWDDGVWDVTSHICSNWVSTASQGD